MINHCMIQCIPCNEEERTRSYGDAWQGHPTQTEMRRVDVLEEMMAELKFEGCLGDRQPKEGAEYV